MEMMAYINTSVGMRAALWRTGEVLNRDDGVSGPAWTT